MARGIVYNRKELRKISRYLNLNVPHNNPFFKFSVVRTVLFSCTKIRRFEFRLKANERNKNTKK